MTEYTNIKREIVEDSEREKSKIAFYIENGYCETWDERYFAINDNGIQKYATDTRWHQYQVGIISREEAVKFATARANRRIDKQTQAMLTEADRIATAKIAGGFVIGVDWVKNRTWGWNPHVSISVDSKIYQGHASGCGYDKESAAVADALNSCDSILKLLCDYKEMALAAGASDEDESYCTRRNNRAILGYGTGVQPIPKFEGGVGVRCFWSALKKCGYVLTSDHESKSRDRRYYTFTFVETY